MGKTAAINRAMGHIKTPLVIFSDANTLLNEEAVRNIVKRFHDPKVGCVAGEKRIIIKTKENATASGEGFYWRFESFIKTNESIVASTMGAVGELFALRTELFNPIPDNSIIDDFVISLTIALNGYHIKYAPDAVASETASLTIKDEMTRKVRIASGGFQTMVNMPQLFNIFRNGMLSFQFISHKALRWTLVPFAFPALFIVNGIIAITSMDPHDFFTVFFYLQAFAYLLVLIGLVVKNIHTRLKFLFFPYYLMIMNLSQILGLVKFLRGNHSVIWDKVKRQ